MTEQILPPGASGDGHPLTRLPRKKARPYPEVLVPLLAASSGILAFLALPALIGAETVFDWLKCAVLALAATAVAFGVNRLALDYGARQAAIGASGAAALSIGMILFVGFAFFTATFAGFVIDRTEQHRLEAFATDRAAYESDRQRRQAAQSDRAPILRAVAEDMAQKAECEANAACVTGGRAIPGTVSRLFETEAGRAQSVLRQIEANKAQRATALNEMTGLQAEAQRLATDDDLGRAERRRALQEITTRIDQTLAGLDDRSADALIDSYGAALAQTAAQVSNPDAARIFAGYADSLGASAGDHEPNGSVRPQFPAPAGVSDTLREIAVFLPVALMIGAVELAFPISLWLYTTFALRAEVLRNGTTPPTAPSPSAARSSKTSRKPKQRKE
ncbi:MAG: DUF4407 domain-containing protein [Rhodobacteraceae bacterium]|nr:DUF4407 domain-containing protein [Paracoccaceae bacterium]